MKIRIGKMEKLLLSIISVMSLTSFATKPIVIERQGQFPVGGTTIERPGTFDPDTFTGWTNPVQDGQTSDKWRNTWGLRYAP
jgi:hypothetical protein